MLITEILERNARMYGPQVALVEREPAKNLRRELTWSEFDEQADKVARALMLRGVGKGGKVVQLMMNCLEWLPVYFGILRTGAWVAPLNFRFQARDIRYCAEIAEARVIFFGPEFVERIEEIKSDLDRRIESYIFAGPEHLRPDFAESLDDILAAEKAEKTRVPLNLSAQRCPPVSASISWADIRTLLPPLRTLPSTT